MDLLPVSTSATIFGRLFAFYRLLWLFMNFYEPLKVLFMRKLTGGRVGVWYKLYKTGKNLSQ